MKSLRTLLPYFRPYRRGVLAGLLLVVASNVFTIGVPWLLKLAIDALQEELSSGLVLRYAALIVAAALVGGAARYGMRELLNGISRRIEMDLRDDLFAHLLQMPAQFYDRWRTGDLMSRATNDALAVRQVAGPAIMYLVNTTTLTALGLALMLWIDPRLTLYAMIPMLVLPPVVYLFGQEINTRFDRIQAQFSELSNFVQEDLAGIRIVKAYSREGYESGRFAVLNEDYLDRNMDLARIWGAFHPSLTLFTGVAAVIALWYGGRLVVAGSISLGDFVAFTVLLTQLTWPMVALGWVTNLFQRGAASMSRINSLLATAPTIHSPEHPRKLGPVRGAIEFEGVSFRYPGTERWVLRDISFRAEPGQRIAIVGATASGKSTLVRLLPRLYDPEGGRVRVDGIDVRELSLEALRDAISMVPQDSFLFSMRLRDNIALDQGRWQRPPVASIEGGAPRRDGRREPNGEGDGGRATKGDLARAIGIAQLEETVKELPAGLDSFLGERGVNLSGGQKQRATLARALYRDAPILVLDDALSAVDSVTETAILSGLAEYMRDRTSLIVSHRVSAVRDSDLILVLEDGRIAERGTHDGLLERGGVYARLLERQLLAEELESENSLAVAPPRD